MARSEGRIAVSIWSDGDFLALNPDAQRMYMFLLSQPDLAHDGVIALRERRWSKSAAGMTLADVGRALADLESARFIVVDEDAEELLIRSFIRGDKVYRQPNVLRAAADHLAVVSSRTILAAIAAELRRVVDAEDIHDGSRPIIAAMLDAIGTATRESGVSAGGNPSERVPEGLAEPLAKATAGPPEERGEVTAVRSDSPSLVPRSSDPVPRGAPPARPPRTRGRGTRIPDDFAVDAEMKTWFAEHCPGVDGPGEHAKFIDYWRAKTGQTATKLDWPATWRNWMRTAAERTRGSTGPRAITAGSSRPSTTDQRVADGLALATRFDQMEAS